MGGPARQNVANTLTARGASHAAHLMPASRTALAHFLSRRLCQPLSMACLRAFHLRVFLLAAAAGGGTCIRREGIFVDRLRNECEECHSGRLLSLDTHVLQRAWLQRGKDISSIYHRAPDARICNRAGRKDGSRSLWRVQAPDHQALSHRCCRCRRTIHAPRRRRVDQICHRHLHAALPTVPIHRNARPGVRHAQAQGGAGCGGAVELGARKKGSPALIMEASSSRPINPSRLAKGAQRLLEAISPRGNFERRGRVWFCHLSP